jgi:uncharacterized protein (DUF111 family)
MKIERTGYGAGTREYQNFPNVLRLHLGDDAAGAEATGYERLVMLETNIDDMSPQIYGHVMEEALRRGALDCYFTPVQMKKNRPGTLISILCEEGARDSLCELLLAETTTLGVRFYEVMRRALERKIIKVETKYGAIDVKVAHLNGRAVKEMPEYEQCRAAAEKYGVALRTVEQAARASFLKSQDDV